ncbi:MAG: helix-turn-helix transcriptional regulator [Marinifilaceae bacterium]|nr:helix-turn-helix transcriptional regulator [Marinifilaceae bacterium]
MEENFAYRLKEILAMRELSCYKLAKMSHVSKGTLSNYINGKIIAPDLMVISKICIVLKISPHWLLHGSGLQTLCESDIRYMRYKTKKRVTRQEIERVRNALNKLFDDLLLLIEESSAMEEFIRKNTPEITQK